MTNYIIPVLIIALLVYCVCKKIDAYHSFTVGAREGLKLVWDIFPFIVAILLAVSLLRYSGFGECLIRLLAPIFQFAGVPSELSEFIMLRPFTGSGSIALLNDILATFGADSYVGRVASTIMGSSETVFFVSAIYFAQTRVKKVFPAIALALFVGVVGVILSCQICKFL